MVWRDPSTISPEDKVLWAGVLRRAVFDYVLYRGSGKHRLQWKKAHVFIFGGGRVEDGLTFEEVCSLFTWDPDYLRRMTKSMTRADIKKLYALSLKDDMFGNTIAERAELKTRVFE
jgi:hypothetical protein